MTDQERSAEDVAPDTESAPTGSWIAEEELSMGALDPILGDALQVSASFSESPVEAGVPFTITTKIFNPYRSPIQLWDLIYQIPYPVQSLNDDEYDEAYLAWRRLSFLGRLLQRSPWRTALQGPGQPFRMSGTHPETKEEVPFDNVSPRESTTYSFKAMVPRWLLTAGRKITLTGEVGYLHHGIQHRSVFNVNLVVRPPLRANLIGAVAGGVLGTTATFLREHAVALDAAYDLTTTATLTVILAVVAVVFASRKSAEVQPILTVEDFWGGLLVGFLMGYLGHEFFEAVVPLAAEG